jgi:uncharacterized protein YggE
METVTQRKNLNMLHKACLLVAFVSAASGSAFAQYGLGAGDNALTGTGTVVIERSPELMRMQVQLLATAPNMKEALAALKTRQESATAQVVALGAVKESIKVEPAALVETANDRNRQIQMMMRQRMQAGGTRKKAPAKTTEPVRLSTVLTADWTLKAKSHEELLTAVHDTQTKLKALDLAGAKEATKLSPEEQELAEEAEAEMAMYGNMGEEDPNKPRFVFLANISDADYEAALADAFKKATVHAERLAKAAGRKLGELNGVSVYDQMQSDDTSEIYNRYGTSAYNLLQRYRQQQTKSDELTAAGVSPGTVKLSVTLAAAYKLQEK